MKKIQKSWTLWKFRRVKITMKEESTQFSLPYKVYNRLSEALSETDCKACDRW
ncbi:unnamed protein product [Arabidopsis halleri]